MSDVYPPPGDALVLTVEEIVVPAAITPDGWESPKHGSPGLMLPAPWEFPIFPIAVPDDESPPDPPDYSVHHVCPRCLGVGGLGHDVRVTSGGVDAHARDDRQVGGEYDSDYLSLPDGDLAALQAADDIEVTVSPSIGCRRCGFHTFLEQSSHRVLSDWSGADGHNGTYQMRMQTLREWRPDVHSRLLEQGYPDP